MREQLIAAPEWAARVVWHQTRGGIVYVEEYDTQDGRLFRRYRDTSLGVDHPQDRYVEILADIE